MARRLSRQNEKALDAEWKRIQQKTFTRWCNEHLKKSSLFIRDLGTDLGDGTLLINLLEMLADKRVGRYNKRPRNYPQKLENVSLALRFIDKEGIRLVNIGKWSATRRLFDCAEYNKMEDTASSFFTLKKKNREVEKGREPRLLPDSVIGAVCTCDRA